MTLAVPDCRPALGRLGRRPRTLPELPAWPVYALFYGFPVWWVTGLGAFIWPIGALVMLSLLLMRREIKVPRSFGIWLLFLLWMSACTLQVQGSVRLVGFAFRALLDVSAAVTLVYVYNARRSLPAGRVALALTAFWVCVVVGGLLGVALPYGGFRTVTELLMPGRLAQNSYVQDLVHVHFSEYNPLSQASPRPSAPFAYTNNWGANFSLLVPFVLIAVGHARSVITRWGILLMIPVALVPAFFTLNRGMFLGLAFGLGYAAVRSAMRGNWGSVLAIAGFGIVGAALTAVIPVQQLIAHRVATTNTNATRSSLYLETINRTLHSPLFGFGTPLPSNEDPYHLTTAGSQGQLWMVMFSFGFVGLALYLGWFAASIWRTRAALTSVQLWCHVVLLMAALELLYYGMQISELQVVMIAAALGMREAEPAAAPHVVAEACEAAVPVPS